MADLKTNYKDDVLDTSKNEKRKFRMIQNDDGTVSFEDATEYTQEGDSFGSADINATNGKVNEINESLAETQDSINESQKNTEKYINERIQTTQKSIEDLRTHTDESIEYTNRNVNDLDSSTQKSIKVLNEEVAKRALTTHVHPVESVGATINTSNFKDTSDSWLSVRKVGHIAICTFSLVTAKALSADADYNICKLNMSALYSVRAAASCSGNITGDVSIQNNALNYIKIATKSALAAGKTVKGEIVFFV